MSSYALSALAIAGALSLLWVVSLPIKDSSIVDIFWGIGFVIIAWVTLAAGPPATARALLVAALTTLWGLRLAGYLAWRNLGKGEDPRYAAMRRKHGDRWPLRSLFIVFWLQGALMWIVSLPVQAAVRAGGGIGAADLAASALVLSGVLFEGVCDAQLAFFKKDPANRGKVMDRGLWRYT